MADKNTPQVDAPDMSIDELSAAIDAHMEDIGNEKPKESAPKLVVEEKPKKSAKTPKPKSDEKVQVKVESKKKTPPKAKKKADEDETKIIVKRGYVSKEKESDKVETPEKEQEEPMSQTSKVELKPIDKEAKTETAAAEKEKTDSSKTVVDVMIKKPKLAEKEKPAEEPGPEEVKPELEEEEKPEIKQDTSPRLAPIPKRGNAEAELDAQLPDPQKTQEVQAEGQADSHTLKTFDTKQYHIPIKPSHHHKKGGSFKLFIAVFVGILAIIYVLSELEIIDLASLVSTF